LRYAETTVWAAEQRYPPTRAKLAAHLGYSSGSYAIRRAQRLARQTYEDLVERPVVDVLAALTRPLQRTGDMPPGRFRMATDGRRARPS